MAYEMFAPQNSFVRFDNADFIQHCIHGEFSNCLPVYAESDVAFQFIVQAETEAEADALCSPYDSGVDIGIVTDTNQPGFTFEFTEQAERFRISPLQVLYNWPHGIEGMIGNIDIGECFYVRVVVDGVNYNSGCFVRISDPCFTSVIEYSNDENFAGFNYCNAGAIDSGGGGETGSCEPEVYSFTNQDQVVIPYTASLVDRFGQVPTVQVWIYDEFGVLTNMGVVAVFDNMPPSLITISMGGPSTGIIIIR